MMRENKNVSRISAKHKSSFPATGETKQIHLGEFPFGRAERLINSHDFTAIIILSLNTREKSCHRHVKSRADFFEGFNRRITAAVKHGTK